MRRIIMAEKENHRSSGRDGRSGRRPRPRHHGRPERPVHGASPYSQPQFRQGQHSPWVEIVHADLDDAASLLSAFQGAHCAYCVTFFWEHMNPEKEFTQARNLAQATKEAKVAHAIWSTLEDTRKLVPLSDNRMPTLGGKYKVPHFDAKGADGLFRAPASRTFLLTSSTGTT
jgi:hypothetical protein